MNNIISKSVLILGIAPSSRGVGFAALNEDKLVDWGVKTVTGDKNKQSLSKLAELISHYRPGVIALEDYSAKDSLRAPRIRKLGQQIIALAKSHKIRVALFSRTQVRKLFIANGRGNKDGVAEILAKRFPEELGSRLPRKRRPWVSEAYQMGIFDAVALAVSARLANKR